MNDKKGVIFDMDGTVWDSSANVAKAWTVKVHEAGYTDKVVTREDIQSVMGKPMRETRCVRLAKTTRTRI